jgi:cytochrome c oxidase subunit II
MTPRLPAVACLCALALVACTGVQSPLAATGDQARAIERVWTLMLWICGTTYVAVLIALGWGIWRRWKARTAANMAGEGVARDRLLSWALAAWVALVVGLLSWLVGASYLADRRLHGDRADLTVRITAKQWWWQVEYLDPDPSRHFITANELRLPRDRNARIELESADVIHSFWVPTLSGKEDLIPGQHNAIVLTPRVTGRFRGQCAEFCGLQHAHMALDVVVEDQAAFEAWRERQLRPAMMPSKPAAIAGAQVFAQSACATCHTVRGTPAGGRSGPDLTHVATRYTLAAGALPMERGAMAAWIADPQHPKPGNQMPPVPLQPRQLADVVEYLMGLE